jgi:uncharacterized membrane protein (UPF0127 family)
MPKKSSEITKNTKNWYHMAMLLILLAKLPLLVLLGASLITGYQLNKLAGLAPAKVREAELITSAAEKPMKSVNIVLAGEKVHVEVAKNDAELTKGLMYRDVMAESVGMLFDFGETSSHSMWMKNTLIPLDMVWIDKNLKIVHAEKNVQPCYTLACPSYSSPKRARYVLELNAGWLDRNNVPVNTYVQIPSLD